MGEVGGKCGGGPLISNQVAALDAFDVPRPGSTTCMTLGTCHPTYSPLVRWLH